MRRIVTLLSLICGFMLFAQAPLVKRKVLILDFVNKNKEDNVSGYLVETIPDALIDPLNETKSFEILPRDTSRELMKVAGLNTADLANENTAIDLAKKTGAQVVVMGSFLVSKSEMIFQARAIETDSGRLAVSKSQRGKINNNMFDLIGKLAKELARDMKTELPPIPQERVVEQVIVGKAVTISVLDLEANGVAEPLGKIAGDAMREALFKQKLYKLIEGQQVRQAVAKAGHSPSGITDIKAAELGQILSSDKVVVGRISKTGDKFEIVARIIDVKTRDVMAAASQKFVSENEIAEACKKIALRFRSELESERDAEVAVKNSGERRFGFDASLVGALAIADLAPALSAGGGVMLSPRYALWNTKRFTMPLRFTTGGIAHFGSSSYGSSLTFLVAPILFGTGIEWLHFFHPKLTAELVVSGGSAVSYLKSNTLNGNYISSDPAVQGLLGVRYRINNQFYLRTSLSYLWVFYAGADLMSTSLNLGAGVSF